MENIDKKTKRPIILVPIIAILVGLPIAFLFIFAASILPSMIHEYVTKTKMFILEEALFTLSIFLISVVLGYFSGKLVSKIFPKRVVFFTIPLIIPIMIFLYFFSIITDNPNPESIPRIIWVLLPLPSFVLGLFLNYKSHLNRRHG